MEHTLTYSKCWNVYILAYLAEVIPITVSLGRHIYTTHLNHE